MNQLKKAIRAGEKSPLVENLLIVEGITRVGKFLLANILSAFEDIEPPQYCVLLEQIPFLAAFGQIEENSAKQLIRCEIDMRCYEMLIGRNLNYRLFDKSSVYNIPNYAKFLKRAKNPDSKIALNNFYEQKAYSLFILHESMPNIKIYFETFPQMKCISLVRNPHDLAYSWYKRGLGKRWGEDPTLFQIPFAKNNSKPFPWFATGWEDLYLRLSDVDRVILSVKSLVQMSSDGYKKLPPEIKKRILIVSFENLTANPQQQIERISKFLGKKTLPQMKTILKRENLPAKLERSRKQKLAELKELASKKYLDELLSLPANYLDFKSKIT